MAAAFPEENAVLDPPPGVSLEDCQALPVWRGPLSNGMPVVITCWKPTIEEWEEMKRTGRVWIIVWGESMPPLAPMGISPFIQSEPEAEDTGNGQSQ